MFLPSVSSSATSHLVKRQRYCNGFNSYDCYSTWDSWGRYAVLAGVIVFALALFFIFACISARRRRSRGAQPFYGTGWMSNQHGNVNYYPQTENNTQQPYYGQQSYGQQPYSAPAPPYSPGGTQQTYYGNREQDAGVELQPPSNTYQPQTGGSPVYAPPEGPPPGKKGDLIR